MNAVVFLLPVAILLGLTFLILFLAAVRDGQFEDLDDPARRVLQDDD